MPGNRFNGFTDYGIGIGLRAPHYQHILTRKPVVDWFEIISENFMIDGGRPLQVLDDILEQYKVVQHGVSMYFGSAERPNREHLRRLKELVKRTKTPWVSDHLCWGSVDGRYTHDLLPMPYTFEAAKITAQKVREGALWLDVRYPSEYQFDKLPGAINVPLAEVRNMFAVLDRSREYVAYCQSGRRSAAAAFLFAQRGFRVWLLEGGLKQAAERSS